MLTGGTAQRPWRRKVGVLAAAGAAGLMLSVTGLGVPATAGTESLETDEGDIVTIARSDPADPDDAQATYTDLMSIPSLQTSYVPESAAPGDDGPQACPPWRCKDFTVPVPEGVNVTSNRVRVLFPKGYHSSSKRYPVVYLFNGARSPYTRWSTGTEVTSITKTLPAIFVMPEGGLGDDAGMFSDWIDGTWQWETFHTDVLVRWVDRRFRTIPGARGTVGASMGGLGALIYPARHPGLYRAAFTLSGAVDTAFMTLNILPPEIGKALGISPPDLTRVWGNPVLHRANWDAHNPTAMAESLEGVKVFVAGGTGDFLDTQSSTGDPLHTGYTEWLMWQGHRTFLGALTEAGIPYRAWVRQGGVHNWPWFDSPLRWGLPKLVRALSR